MNDNEVRKAPDALERVPEMLDTPPNRYHCISKPLSDCWGAFFCLSKWSQDNLKIQFDFYLLKNGKNDKKLVQC